MEISSQEDHDIPIPINSTYGGGHGHIIHHHHHDAAHVTSAPLTHNNGNNPQMPPNGNNNGGNGRGDNYEHHQHDHDQDHHRHLVGYSSINYKKQVGVKYKECLKNHAASMGGNATDGCGEFMPSGEEGSIEALTCSACNCHRNFHRKEVEGEVMLYHHHPPPPPPPPPQRKLVLAHHPHNPHKIRSAVPHQMIMPPYMGIGVGGSHPYMPNSESEDQMDEDGGGGLVSARPAHHQPFNQHSHHHQQLKKRFRTKFTQEQKEKMLNFAERAGWKIQRQEESVVQQFCQEIGVKRRVLKVWMHNNKHNLAKKNNSNGDNINLTGNSDSKNNAIGNLASSAEENM